ncbi:MAG: redoxin domain-containing protein [Acidobacteria bacterium]|nr:redoxin domain-containing protein [Acidobacteriota bacterium]
MIYRAMLMVLAVLLAASAVPATVGGNSSEETKPYDVGATVSADIKLKDINGKEHALGDYRGKVVFIHFWSIVCPTLKASEPKCKSLQSEFGDKGVVQIAINANQKELSAGGDTYANLREHVEKAGVNFLVTVDPGNKITDLFGGKTTPHCFVIDREGVLRYAGALDDDPKGDKGEQATPYVRNAIEALLAGAEVPVTTSKPYG